MDLLELNAIIASLKKDKEILEARLLASQKQVQELFNRNIELRAEVTKLKLEKRNNAIMEGFNSKPIPDNVITVKLTAQEIKDLLRQRIKGEGSEILFDALQFYSNNKP
jgi:predicted metal-dependent hydrolase